MAMFAENEGRMKIIVLLPECLVRDAELAREVRKLALQKQMDVLFLTLLEDEEKALMVARSMVTLKALIGDHQYMIQSRVVAASIWIKTLQETCRPGDVIVYFAEQTVRDGLFRTRALSEFLPHVIKAPLVALTGYYHPQKAYMKAVLKDALTWFGFLLILAAFTLVEFTLDSGVHDLVHQILLVMLMVMEFGTLLVWNNLTSR